LGLLGTFQEVPEARPLKVPVPMSQEALAAEKMKFSDSHRPGKRGDETITPILN